MKRKWKRKERIFSFLIEKKISENAYQNQTQIGMGEASCENWPHAKVS